MHISDIEESLSGIRWLAVEYVKVKDDRAARDARKAITKRVATFSGVQMAHFCQQVVSHIDNVHKATDTLTVLTNQVIDHLMEMGG